MAFKFQPGRIYRMPVAFGPAYGPRSGIGGSKHDTSGVKTTTYSVSFLTRREQLEAIVPPDFEIGAEPVVTISVLLLREVQWLAGRGYNIVSVTFPVVYQGARERAVGDFMPVLWENMADPIITGRDEIGYSKIYADIPDPRTQADRVDCVAGWLGFKFMDMQIRSLVRLSPQEMDTHRERGTKTPYDGLMHYKYIPRTGEPGEPDISYPVIRPGTGGGKVTEMWRGQGTVEFHKATWEDLPTMVDVVNVLCGLKKVEYRGASVIRSIGSTDLSETRRLR